MKAWRLALNDIDNQCFSAKNLEDALTYETEHSAKVLTTEAIVGAKKFAAGMGKHGKFNVNKISEKEVIIRQYNRTLQCCSLVGMAEGT